MLRWIVWRDLMLAWRRRSDMLSTVFFFVIVVSLFPLGIGPETQLLRTIAPGVVWVAALLASMLSLGRLFLNDYHDGTLEQLLLTPQPLFLVVLGKTLAHWIVAEVPLVLIAPLLGAHVAHAAIGKRAKDIRNRDGVDDEHGVVASDTIDQPPRSGSDAVAVGIE